MSQKIYTCLCGYSCKNKRSNMKDHLNKKNKCGIYTDDEINDILHTCKYCEVIYTDKNKHYSICKQKKLIENTNNNNNNNNNNEKNYDYLINKIKEMELTIAKLSNSSITNQTINQNTQNTQNTQNIKNQNIQNNYYYNYFVDYRQCDFTHVSKHIFMEKLYGLYNTNSNEIESELCNNAVTLTYFDEINAPKQNCILYVDDKIIKVFKDKNFVDMSLYDFFSFVIRKNIKLLIEIFLKLSNDQEFIDYLSTKKYDYKKEREETIRELNEILEYLEKINDPKKNFILFDIKEFNELLKSYHTLTKAFYRELLQDGILFSKEIVKYIKSI